MIITNIGIRKKGLYALTFDGLPAFENAELETDNVLLIYRETFDRKRYSVGSRLDTEQIEQLICESACERAYSKALWLLNYHDSTRRAMCDKLKKEFPQQAAEYAVKRLCELHIIDDERYAARYAEILIVNKNTPKRRAVYKLMEKGVPREIAERACEWIEVDSSGQLDEIIRKKYALRLGSEAEVKKAVAALMRKGFTFHDIKSAIAKYTQSDIYEGED